MAQPLTPREQAALQELAEELERDDPRLAEDLRRHGARGQRSPRAWPAWVWVLIGTAFVVAGLGLAVSSAVTVGLVSLGIGAYRSATVRSTVRQWLTKVLQGL